MRKLYELAWRKWQPSSGTLGGASNTATIVVVVVVEAKLNFTDSFSIETHKFLRFMLDEYMFELSRAESVHFRANMPICAVPTATRGWSERFSSEIDG